MPFWKWSHTASANASSDSSINWAEGMAPSAVNDSARAMMARLAEWRDDVSGTIVTAGAATAYTVASNQGFDNLPDLNGAMIAFVPHTTSTAGSPSVTLAVDGLAAKPIRFAPGLDLPSGTLIQGTPYVVTYNNTDGAFYLQGFTNPYGIPIGGLISYTGFSAPNSAFVLPAGQAISRTTYATLWSLVGTSFGSGDGSTTFNVPDLRGRVVAALDNLNGTAAGRIGTSVATDGGTVNGQALGGNGGSATHLLTQAELPVISITPTFTGSQSDVTNSSGNEPLVQDGVQGQTATGGGQFLGAPGTGANQLVVTPQGTVSTISFGSGNAHSLLPPTIILGAILRVM